MRASSPPAGLTRTRYQRAPLARPPMPPGMRISSRRAAALLGGDGQPVDRLRGVRIVGEEALDRVQVARVRRAGELQEGGVRPERRAVGGRHQHALHHVLEEGARRPAVFGGELRRLPKRSMPAAAQEAPPRRPWRGCRGRRARRGSPRLRQEQIAAGGADQRENRARRRARGCRSGSAPSPPPQSRFPASPPTPAAYLPDSGGAA